MRSDGIETRAESGFFTIPELTLNTKFKIPKFKTEQKKRTDRKYNTNKL
jgi:hypothetical protein